MKQFLFSTVAIFAVFIISASAKKAGGLGKSKPADDTVRQLVQQLRPQIIQKICDNLSNCPSSTAKITVNSYKTQVVSGINYFVSVTIEGITYHLRIYNQSWNKILNVSNVQGPKKDTDKITYF